jgi:hypothetical protein
MSQLESQGDRMTFCDRATRESEKLALRREIVTLR